MLGSAGRALLSCHGASMLICVSSPLRGLKKKVEKEFRKKT